MCQVPRAVATLVLLISGMVAEPGSAQSRPCRGPIFGCEAFEGELTAIGIAVSDVNGDGLADVVGVQGAAGPDVFIRFGEGGGFLSEEIRLPVVTRQKSDVGIEDLDGDGLRDIVVCSQLEQRVIVLMNQGGSGADAFRSQRLYDVGTGCSALDLGDLDGDGDIDVVVVNEVSDDMSVLLNRGDGTFRPERREQAGDAPADVVLADLDGDGHLDAAIASSATNDVRLLYGRGDGDFDGQIAHPVASLPTSLGIADMDGDGALDVVVGCQGTSQVSVLLNAGSRTFSPEVRYDGVHSMRVLPHDTDHDGDIDVLLSSSTLGVLRVLHNDGHGVLSDPVDAAVGSPLRSLTVADLTGDGVPDLIGSAYRLTLLRGRQSGDFAMYDAILPEVGHVTSVAGGDLDQDGAIDVVATTYDRRLVFALQQDDGSFEVSSSFTDQMYWTNISLLDADGDLDLDAAIFAQSGDLLLSRNDGTGHFSIPEVTHLNPASRPIAKQALDTDSDGDLDLVILTGTQVLFVTNDGSGGFHQQLVLDLPSPAYDMASGDIDGDTDVEILIGSEFGILVVRSDGSGTWHLDDMLDVGKAVSIALDDFTGDDRPDLLVADGVNRVTWADNDGLGNFPALRSSMEYPGVSSVALVDLDGSSVPESVVFRSDMIDVLYKFPGVTVWFLSSRYLNQTHLSRPSFVDLNGDDRLDMIFAAFSSIRVAMHMRPHPIADWIPDRFLNLFDPLGYLADFAGIRPEADLNEDGMFDMFDLLIFLDAFDEGCT